MWFSSERSVGNPGLLAAEGSAGYWFVIVTIVVL